MSKKVNIHVSRRITVSRPGQEPVVLEPGRNTVDEDVARHPYVKHFLTDEPAVVDNAEADALRARVTELEEQLAQKTADLDALVASMSAPAETGTKGKGK